ncbi:MAG: response regulator, partial [Gammaproteobacteria bacterium]|nr:response regulator [Gammaproteobacteria bacterium]
MSISNNKLPRILAIDDQADNLQIIGLTLLNSHQYSVNFAQSGESALELMETISPDLILLDVMMPGVGGYELCQQLKRDPRFREIPVIFLSAKSEAADVVTGFEVGGADYITKPFEPTILLARVDTQIRARLAQLQEERLRDHMSLILNSMTEGLAVFDPDGIIYQINPKLE